MAYASLRMQLTILNPKFEALNTRQIQISKFENSKHHFEFMSLELQYCLGFRVLIVGFNLTK